MKLEAMVYFMEVVESISFSTPYESIIRGTAVKCMTKIFVRKIQFFNQDQLFNAKLFFEGKRKGLWFKQ